jgi:hypothetical protein
MRYVMMFTLSFTALGANSIRYLRMQAWRLTSLPKKGLHADVRLHLLISYVWVGLPPFLSLPLSSQRTLCLGFFLPFLFVFAAGLLQLSASRERRACVFGWTLLWFYWHPPGPSLSLGRA